MNLLLNLWAGGKVPHDSHGMIHREPSRFSINSDWMGRCEGHILLQPILYMFPAPMPHSSSLFSHSFRKQKHFQKQAARFSYSHQLKGHFFFIPISLNLTKTELSLLRPFLMCVTAHGDWGGGSEMRMCMQGTWIGGRCWRQSNSRWTTRVNRTPWCQAGFQYRLAWLLWASVFSSIEGSDLTYLTEM